MIFVIDRFPKYADIRGRETESYLSVLIGQLALFVSWGRELILSGTWHRRTFLYFWGCKGSWRICEENWRVCWGANRISRDSVYEVREERVLIMKWACLHILILLSSLITDNSIYMWSMQISIAQSSLTPQWNAFNSDFPIAVPQVIARTDTGRTHRNAAESMGRVLGAAFDAAEVFDLWERIQEN